MEARERLTAVLAQEAKVRSLGGGQTFPSREDSDKEKAMDIRQREDKKFQPMGKMDDLEASYDQLVALFDLPNAGPSPDDKIDVQWDLLVEGVKVSVWNWKDGQKYGGHISRITSWSIWAEDTDAIEYLQDFFAGQSDLSQEELMAAVVEAVRHDKFTVSDNYLKGCDYLFGGGYMVSCEGSQFGSLRYQGGGVSFGSEPIAFFITEADEVPLLVNRVVMAWGSLQDEWASAMPDAPDYGSFEGNEAPEDEPEWDRKYDKGGASR